MNQETGSIVDRIGWVATVMSVAGVVLNNFRLWPCFAFWMASNAMSAWIHARTHTRSLLVRDLIFLSLSVLGLWQWTR